MKVIESDNSSVNPFYFTPNILLFSCNLIELWILLQRKFNFFSSYTEKIQIQVSTIAAMFIESIEDEYSLRALVFEKDFDNRDSLNLLSLYNIVDIMNNKNMEKIALELWSSQYDVKGNLMTTSSVFKIVMDENFKKPWDVLGDYLFTNWHNRRLENFEHHMFQFQVWKNINVFKICCRMVIFDNIYNTLSILFDGSN